MRIGSGYKRSRSGAMIPCTVELVESSGEACILLTEGSGHESAGGTFGPRDIVSQYWIKKHLRCCNASAVLDWADGVLSGDIEPGIEAAKILLL